MNNEKKILADWPTMAPEQRRILLNAILPYADQEHLRQQAEKRIGLTLTGNLWEQYASAQDELSARRQAVVSNQNGPLDQYAEEERARNEQLIKDAKERNLTRLVESNDPMAQYEAERMFLDRIFFGPGE